MIFGNDDTTTTRSQKDNKRKKWPCLRRCWEASRWRPVRALTSLCTSSESICSPGDWSLTNPKNWAMHVGSSRLHHPHHHSVVGQEDCEQPLPPARDQDGRRPDVYWHIHQVDLLEKKMSTTKVTITRPFNQQFQEHKDQVPVGHSMGGVHCWWENHSDYHHYWGQLHHQGEDTITIVTFSIFNATMVKVQTPDAATGYHTTREEREFSEDGTTMTLRFQGIFKRIIKDGSAHWPDGF